MLSGKSLPVVAGSRVELRGLTERDVPALFDIFSSEEAMRYWSHSAFTDESDAVEYLDSVRRGFESKSLFQWGIARREDDTVIGTCTLWQLDPQNQRAEVGFVLGQEHWRQGLMTEALGALFDFSFQDLGLRRLEADVDPDNEASIALLEQLGFAREGYLRERWSVEGKVTDSVFYGLLARDWRRLGNG